MQLTVSEAGHFFVIEVRFHDGRRAHPAYVREGAPDWQSHLDEAVEHFEKVHQGLDTVNVNCARTLALAGASSPESIPEWQELHGQG